MHVNVSLRTRRVRQRGEGGHERGAVQTLPSVGCNAGAVPAARQRRRIARCGCVQAGEASGLSRLRILVVLGVGQIGHVPPRARAPARGGRKAAPGGCDQRQNGQKGPESEGRNARARPRTKVKAASSGVVTRVAEFLTLSAELGCASCVSAAGGRPTPPTNCELS